MNARYSALLRSIIERGISSCDFLDLDVGFACQVIDAIVLETIRGTADRSTAYAVDEPDLAAGFVLRGLLRAPSRLTRLRGAARTLDR